MKIVHLTTSDTGGAGIAAKQLHLALLQGGHESSFVSKVKLGPDFPSHIVTGDSFSDSEIRKYYLNNKKGGFDYFSFPYSDFKLESLDVINSADIIHLHWISDGFTDYKNVFSLPNKKFVWTLHDMNPFTGGCHHSDGCIKFTKLCNYCPHLEGTVDEYISFKIHNYKKEALKNITGGNLKIVTPSKWLSDLSQKSECLKRFKHTVIPNIIHLPSSEIDREEARLKLGIHKDEIALLFVANGLDNPRKGLSALISALQGISRKDNLKIITVGGDEIKMEGLHNLNLGYVSDGMKMAETYTAADAFILPSLAENFPNTIVESLLCGTPVIASVVGGIPEQINNENGILVNSHSVEDWKHAINNFMNGKIIFNREQIKNEAMNKYESGTILGNYLNLYNSFS